MHLVVNPSAGRGRGLARLDDVVRALESASNPGVRVLRSERPGHARELVAEVPDGGTVVAVGGDGTVHELLPACLERGLTLGIVPAGSGDDFAFALGIPRDDPLAAAAIVRSGHVRRVDAGLVNGEPFVNAFGSGFDADVGGGGAPRPPPAPPGGGGGAPPAAGPRPPPPPRRYKGLARYLYGILTAMRDFRLATVRVEIEPTAPTQGAAPAAAEGAPPRVVAYEGPSLLVTVQNGPRAGGSFLFAPRARLDDGAFDVLIAGAFGRLGTLGILPRLMRGRHLGHPRVHALAARSLRVQWSTDMAAQAEGELLARSSSFEVRLLPRALRVLAPAPGATSG